MRQARVARNHTGHVVGEHHPRARLSDAQVRAIRAAYRPGGRRGVRGGGGGCVALARHYGCSPSTIHNIVTWATRWSA